MIAQLILDDMGKLFMTLKNPWLAKNASLSKKPPKIFYKLKKTTLLKTNSLILSQIWSHPCFYFGNIKTTELQSYPRVDISIEWLAQV